MSQRFSVSWSDYRGGFVGAKSLGYRIEPMGWGILPPKFQRYRIMCGTVEIGKTVHVN